MNSCASAACKVRVLCFHACIHTIHHHPGCVAGYQPDSFTGKTIYGYTMDSCPDENFWCQVLPLLRFISVTNTHRLVCSSRVNFPAGLPACMHTSYLSFLGHWDTCIPLCSGVLNHPLVGGGVIRCYLVFLFEWRVSTVTSLPAERQLGWRVNEREGACAGGHIPPGHEQRLPEQCGPHQRPLQRP